MPTKPTKKRAKTAADPIAKLAARVATLERREAERRELAVLVAKSMQTPPAAPAQNAPPRRAEQLAAELLQEEYQRLRGERLATVRKSLGMGARPLRDLLPRWMVWLLARWGF